MQIKKIVLAALFMNILTSFAPAKTKNNVTGTYSTCDCENSKNEEKKFGLTLKDDQTFHYFDYSSPAEKIDINGIWVLSKNIISLKNYSSGHTIERQWKIEKNGKCIKSRLGLKFTRICNVATCN